MTYTQIWDLSGQVIEPRAVMRDRDGAIIPFDPENRDYQAYQAWLAEGNAPNPPLAKMPKENSP